MTIKTTTATALTALLLAGVLPSPATSAVRMNIAGPNACKSASGFGTNAFYYDSQYVQNTTNTTQYLTCHIPEINPGTARSAEDVQVLLRNPTGATITFTCALQAGYSVNGVNTSVFTINVPANDVAVLSAGPASTPALPTRTSQYAPYTMSCAVPGQGRIDAITVGYPETF